MRNTLSSVAAGALLCALLILAACGEQPATVKTYAVRGVFIGPQYEGAAMLVEHERIPGYMEAMRMPFKVEASEALTGYNAGDKIAFTYTVTEEGGVASGIRRLPDSTRLELATTMKTSSADSAAAL